jgi:blue light- and temperature-responsive anti-repressor
VTFRLFRLIYGSENHLRGSEAEVTAEVAGIMASSTRNNQAAGITGALLFTGAYFTQVLEGPRTEVERTFERISQDFRHGGVMIIDLHEAHERAFDTWSMALLDTRDWAETERSELGRLTGQHLAAADGNVIVEVLRRFVAQRMHLREPA